MSSTAPLPGPCAGETLNPQPFRVQGSGFRVQGSVIGVQGSGFGVQGPGFRVEKSGLRVEGLRPTRSTASPAGPSAGQALLKG